MSKYKMGEKILVRGFSSNDWNERIFIKDGKNKSAICVMEEEKKKYFSGEDFMTQMWEYHKKLPEKKYVPFTWEDRDLLRGRWIKSKEDDKELMIIGFSKEEVFLIHTDQGDIYHKGVLDFYTFLDGTPCGKLVEEEE